MRLEFIVEFWVIEREYLKFKIVYYFWQWKYWAIIIYLKSMFSSKYLYLTNTGLRDSANQQI